jgi:hypothetical protein
MLTISDSPSTINERNFAVVELDRVTQGLPAGEEEPLADVPGDSYICL